MSEFYPYPVFQMQDVIMRATALTQNQWYDGWDGSAVAAGAGSVKKHVRIHSISMDQAVGNEDIEVRIIADNFDETPTLTLVAGTNYGVRIQSDPDGPEGLVIGAVVTPVELAFVLEARNVAIMYRKTTATGANNTTIKIIYSQTP